MSDHDIAVSVRGLSKSYTIAHNAAKHTTLGEAIVQTFKNPLAKKAETETFWALKDVEFDIKKGDVVGIIGRNGAGKSTLLKVLSRITEPTTGQIDIYGRVGSLLEVGTGFHPELTGRENIFMNGAILGMSKREITRHFDDIVEFAEVEQFLDTPVKRYSSGMYVRLAFAVAAHLNPEILIVDEVLAVGDAAFQKKCLGKMQDVAREGRTVIFVSHNMPTVLRLCRRVILLKKGQIEIDSNPNEVTKKYLSSDTGRASERFWQSDKEAPGDEVARLRSVSVLNSQRKSSELIDIHQPLFIQVEYWNLQSKLFPTVSLHLINEEGVTIFASNDFNNRLWRDEPRQPGLVRTVCCIPGTFLAEGRFTVLAAVCTYNPDVVHAIEQDAVAFQVVDSLDKGSIRETFARDWPGVVRPMLEWEVTCDNEDFYTQDTSQDDARIRSTTSA